MHQVCDGNYTPVFARILHTNRVPSKILVEKQLSINRTGAKVVIKGSAVKPQKKTAKHTKKPVKKKTKKETKQIQPDATNSLDELKGKFEQFRRLRNPIKTENMLNNTFDFESDEKFDSTGEIFVTPTKPRVRTPLVSPEINEQVEVQTPLHFSDSDSVEEEEPEQEHDSTEQDYILRRFIRMFLTPSVFEERKSGRSNSHLVFPRAKERPLVYSNDNGDLIIDVVSEMLAELDLTNMSYENLIELVSSQIRRRSVPTAFIIKNMTAEFQANLVAQKMQITTDIADQILRIELDRCLYGLNRA